ncbi:MAG TPA: PD-(D/E)XK nuclease family protein, partial [Solirubrobacterales bacterium]|nr:PD-(D/E)XK nuclease family protein [Solirubrobacterales bacterium]
ETDEVPAAGAPRAEVASIHVPPPEPRPGLDEIFGPSEIAVHLNLPSPERAAELRDLHLDAAAERPLGSGTPPLVERRPPIVPSRPLSYTAISAFEECAYRFYMERVLGLPGAAERVRSNPRIATRNANSSAEAADTPERVRTYPEYVGISANSSTGAAGPATGVHSSPDYVRESANALALAGDEGPSAREERSARGAAVHALLEWSLTNDWREPTADLARRHALAAGLDLDAARGAARKGTTETASGDADAASATAAGSRASGDAGAEELLGPVRDWLGSPLRSEIAAASRVRAEVPILLGAGGTVLRGSIDLLVEREGAPPLVVDYKTDRLRGEDPATRAAHYEVQRSIYALAAAESLGASEVEVAYVFLERADSPVRTVLTAADMETGRARIDAAVAAISAGDFSPAPELERTWDLCRGCPALGRLCSGPAEEQVAAA